jgi:hypothetical protein
MPPVIWGQGSDVGVDSTAVVVGARRFLLVSNKGLQDDRTVVVAAAAFRPGEGAKDSVFEV